MKLSEHCECGPPQSTVVIVSSKDLSVQQQQYLKNMAHSAYCYDNDRSGRSAIILIHYSTCCSAIIPLQRRNLKYWYSSDADMCWLNQPTFLCKNWIPFWTNSDFHDSPTDLANVSLVDSTNIFWHLMNISISKFSSVLERWRISISNDGRVSSPFVILVECVIFFKLLLLDRQIFAA